MAKTSVYNMEGTVVSEIELNDNIFDIEINEHVVHQSVVQYLANQRQGTHAAKTRSEVRGGGRKPWKQKGTGRARQGSIRSPQWTGGGVVFAKKPRDFGFKLNKKVKRLALKSVLTSKVKEEQIIVLDELKFDDVKTKKMVNVLGNFDISKALVVIGDNSDNVLLSARNIKGVKTAGVNSINTYDLIKYEKFVVTKEALEKIQEVYA